jgi:RNA polymerase sigma factor (sigma-70 family)
MNEDRDSRHSVSVRLETESLRLARASCAPVDLSLPATATAIRSEEYIGLAHFVANRFRSAIARGVDRDDIIGEATLALVIAAPHFDADRGARASTFLTRAMVHAVARALRRRHYRPLLGLLVDVDQREMEPEDHRSPELLTAEQHDDIALLDRLMRRLTLRERQVLELRYGFTGEEHTLEEIGRVLRLTRERIRQIEARALARLRLAAIGVGKNRRQGEDTASGE